MSISLNLERWGEKIDIAQDALDFQVWEDVKKYMPMSTGALIEETSQLNRSVRGEVYMYPPGHDYGHYQYEGIVYVDPVYLKGGFYSEEFGWWSRPGVQKIPSDRFLFYGRDTAEAHWDEVAIRNHESEWVAVAKRAVR